MQMQEMKASSLGQEDLLEKEMATHSSILAWKIPWVEKPGSLHHFQEVWRRKLMESNDRIKDAQLVFCLLKAVSF